MTTNGPVPPSATGTATEPPDLDDEAVTALGEALKCPDAFGNAFLWLRLGQALHDSGNPDRATEALPSAYMLEGPEFFEDEDPRYLSFLAGRVDLSSA